MAFFGDEGEHQGEANLVVVECIAAHAWHNQRSVLKETAAAALRSYSGVVARLGAFVAGSQSAVATDEFRHGNEGVLSHSRCGAGEETARSEREETAARTVQPRLPYIGLPVDAAGLLDTAARIARAAPDWESVAAPAPSAVSPAGILDQPAGRHLLPWRASH